MNAVQDAGGNRSWQLFQRAMWWSARDCCDACSTAMVSTAYSMRSKTTQRIKNSAPC